MLVILPDRVMLQNDFVKGRQSVQSFNFGDVVVIEVDDGEGRESL